MEVASFHGAKRKKRNNGQPGLKGHAMNKNQSVMNWSLVFYP
ncbi:hypothetical protein FCR2A7T_07930 [Flavobacterium cauense R2A-7]|nr:hypothetical protein FCR2A7T_07930 [Flavobacterium cauense R2A-7]